MLPRRTLLTALAIALLPAPAAVAHDPQHRAHAVIAPARDELLGEAFVEGFSQPAVARPGCIRLAAPGNVLQPVPGPDRTAACTAQPGTALFVHFGTVCDNIEEPPFFGRDEAEQRACAAAFDRQFVARLELTVDNAAPVELRTPRYELASPQRTVRLPADNVFGVAPQTITFAAHAWGALVRNLRPGHHTVAVHLVTTELEEATFTFTVDVVPGRDRGDE